MRKLIVGLILVCSMGFAGCAAKEYDPETFPPLADNWLRMLKRHARIELKDSLVKIRIQQEPILCSADSTSIFRDAHIPAFMKGTLVGHCGLAWVNTRNAENAYLGEEPYLYMFDENNEIAIFTNDMERWVTNPKMDLTPPLDTPHPMTTEPRPDLPLPYDPPVRVR